MKLEDVAANLAGVQRTEEQQKKSTEEMNERLKEKERTRKEEQERWNATGPTGMHDRGPECAREMAGMDHPHDDDDRPTLISITAQDML